MILPDTNLLLYAFNPHVAQHRRAASWWESCVNGAEAVGLTWSTVVAFVRLTTKDPVFDPVPPVGDVLDEVEAWLARPHDRIIEPKPTHVQAMRSIAEPLGLGGDVMNDVHLAALALEYGAVVHTADRDFARFTGVRWLNPLD